MELTQDQWIQVRYGIVDRCRKLEASLTKASAQVVAPENLARELKARSDVQHQIEACRELMESHGWTEDI
jgi:hypothetical protein